MPVQLGVVMDPITHINPLKDTTLLLLLAAIKKDWTLVYFEQKTLFFDNNIAKGYGRALSVYDDSTHWYSLGEEETIVTLGDLDVLLMRTDPPFDIPFLQTTFILEAAQAQGALVVNDPRSLRDCNEKLFATQFPECCPPLTVSQDPKHLRQFHQQHGDVIFKPLDGMGGSGIFRCRADDPNIGVILETLTHSNEMIMAQKFIPDIRNGDKRILVIDGEAVPYCLARVPAKGETRGNLAAGGKGHTQPLSERDQWIVEQVAPTLRSKGLLFVGLDVIGDYLTEINVTSPTCAQEIDRAHQTDIGGRLMNAIEQRLNS